MHNKIHKKLFSVVICEYVKWILTVVWRSIFHLGHFHVAGLRHYGDGSSAPPITLLRKLKTEKYKQHQKIKRNQKQ
jgi:hypothetical protein